MIIKIKALGYGLDDRGFEFRQRLGIFLFTTCSGVHPDSYLMGTRGSFPGGKAAGFDADHTPPSSAEAKNVSSYTSAPPVRLHGVAMS